jgi:MFS family permease
MLTLADSAATQRMFPMSSPTPPFAQSAPELSLWREMRSLPRTYWALFCGIFINRFGSFVYPFLTITLTRRGFANWEIGLALGGYGIGGLAATLCGGWFADRFGRRATISWGALANALSVLAMTGVSSLPLFLCLTILTGFTVGFIGPAASALVADVVPERLRLRAYAGTRMAANAGFACGTALGGMLVNSAPVLLFVGDAVTTAAYGLLAALMLPRGVVASRQEAGWAEAWKVLRRDGAFWSLFAAQLCVALTFAQFSTTYAKEITRRNLTVDLLGIRLTTEQVFGLLIGWNGAMIVALEIFSTRITQRFPPRPVMALGTIMLGAGFAANAAAGSFAALFAAMTVFTLGEMLAVPLVSTTVAGLAPEKMRGRYLGALSLAWAMGSLLGPQMGFALYGWHPEILWAFCGLLGLAGAAIHLLGGARQRRSPQPSSEAEGRSDG